ncbi:uncharacterized protein E0L32_009204 [Thyridium curvatum]|uniref:Tetratricopeptide repeat and J domain-containing co-chaperone DNJ1 n=1 Tax=Thyridium curvatum TaxID=1093900 RepID=A0A507APB5_9PEZI|nr:uncharacterized protein E0L32_009204 [Thyridium curvatum]TPX09603.1 hypothetical protein E0L32_009204 [Thyridium curvatum]
MLIRLSTVALAASFLTACPSTLVAALSSHDIPADTPVSALLASAQGHLSKGETNDALVYYDAAIARDPSNYLTFFKRATTYLSLGRMSQAVDDFEKVLAIKPGFEGAHVQLGRIKQRTADWEGARTQFLAAGKTPASKELQELQEAQGAATLAEEAERAGKWEECASHADVAISVANRAVSLREIRSHCRFEQGSLEQGMSDLQHILSMRPGDTTPHVKISAMQFYALGDLDKGMAQIRKCLHSDPDSKVCKKLLRQEKAVDKALARAVKAFEKKQYMSGVKHLVPSGEDEEGLIKEVKDQVRALREDKTIPPAATDSLVVRLVSMACEAYYETNSRKAKTYCDEALSLDENAFYGLLHKHKTQLAAELFEEAVRTLQKAIDAHPDKQDVANPLMHEAQVKLKRSKTKDYYKVLGVAHDADERQIKAAYRRMSKQHHPDKAAKQGLSKEDAEKKMAGINEAYEVLSNPELRARFDAGDDPNSHEGQQGGGGNPFQQGGFQHPFMFQQGGQQFKFQYGSGGFPGGFGFGG